MSYIPHSLIAASPSLQGTIVLTHPVNAPGKYPIFVDVRLIGVPDDNELVSVRYAGTLKLIDFVNTNNPSVGYYKDLATAFITGAAGRTWEDWENKVKQALQGRLVEPVKLGGRWWIRS
jgi:hypothetical protein